MDAVADTSEPLARKQSQQIRCYIWTNVTAGGWAVVAHPRAAEARTADHDTLGARGRQHGERIVGGEDVTVTDDGHGQRVRERRDAGPVHRRRVQLLGVASVERNRGCALLRGDPARLLE